MFRNIFRKKHEGSGTSPGIDAHYDTETGELSFNGHKVRVVYPEYEDEYAGQRSIQIIADGRSIYVSRDEFIAMSVYFCVMFGNKEE